MPASNLQTFRAMAYNNAWANDRLLTACAALSASDFAARRVSFFPSLQATLNHLYVVDLFYIDALEGGWIGPKAWADEVPFPALPDLSRAQRAIDARLIVVCEALTADLLDVPLRINRGSQVQTERRDRLLLHLFLHQTHHRGQAHAMLAGTSVAPPQLDEFFSHGDAPLRAGEFARLGWSEDLIWGQ